MNLTDLEFVIAVERHGSISKAAKELFVAQPNLSKVIRTLEKNSGLSSLNGPQKEWLPPARGRHSFKKLRIS